MLSHYVLLHSLPSIIRCGRTSGRLVFTGDISERILCVPMYYKMGMMPKRLQYKMKIINAIDSKCKIDLLIIFILYSISFFLLLINLGVFWDDWTLYNMSSTIILDKFKQAGIPYAGYFHNFLLSIGNGVSVYRILAFVTYFLSAVFLYFILYKIDEIDRFDCFLIVTFFAILPVNSARIALIDSPYALCHFLFWLGFLFLSLYLKDNKIVFRIIALMLFFLSFVTASLLVFYVLVVLYIAYFEFYKWSLNDLFIKKIIKYSDFIVLPIVYWVIKTLYFTPYGLYAEYNQLSLKKLYYVPQLLLLSLYTSFVELFKQLFITNSFILLIILGIVIFPLLQNRCSQKANDRKFMFFYFGWFLFFLAVYPYTAVGRNPGLIDWNSRHQLLIPLGVSIIIIYGIKILIPFERIQKIFYSLFISSFLLTNISLYIDFQKDWYKQVSLIENFKTNEIIKGNTTFLFDDRTELNANHRLYRFYEYSGLMKYVFGRETKFGDTKQNFDGIGEKTQYLNVHYNLKDYKIKNPEYVVEIHENKTIHKKDLIRLKYLELFMPDKLRENVRELIVLKYQKLTY